MTGDRGSLASFHMRSAEASVLRPNAMPVYPFASGASIYSASHPEPFGKPVPGPVEGLRIDSGRDAATSAVED